MIMSVLFMLFSSFPLTKYKMILEFWWDPDPMIYAVKNVGTTLGMFWKIMLRCLVMRWNDLECCDVVGIHDNF